MGSDRAGETVRVLVGKPGLDGHDRGAKVVARMLRDQGFEVVYSGLHQSIESIAQIALQEDVDIVGLSVLSGSHLPYTRDLRGRLDELGMDDVAIVIGGIIPLDDEGALRAAGADDIFPVGTNVLAIGDRLRGLVAERRGGGGR